MIVKSTPKRTPSFRDVFSLRVYYKERKMQENISENIDCPRADCSDEGHIFIRASIRPSFNLLDSLLQENLCRRVPWCLQIRDRGSGRHTAQWGIQEPGLELFQTMCSRVYYDQASICLIHFYKRCVSYCIWLVIHTMAYGSLIIFYSWYIAWNCINKKKNKLSFEKSLLS